VFNWISGQSLAQTDAEYFEFAVGQIPEYLRVTCLRVRGETSGQMDSVGQMNLPRRLIGARRPDITHDVHRRGIFKVESTKDSNGIHRMKNWRLRGVSERIDHAETLHARPEIRRVQSNNLGILSSGFREHILVRGNYVGDPHVSVVGISARPRNMALQVN